MLERDYVMKDLTNRIKEAENLIHNATYIIIGAGAGLSESAGFHYADERFDSNFNDFKENYGITDMYSGTFYEFETEEERWAFLSRMVQCNTYETKQSLVYQKLLTLVKNKEYFVLTTNADNQFTINGFDMNRYFETQGNYTYLQCQSGCHDKIYKNNKIIQEMVSKTINCKVPSNLIPTCPICDGKMDIHIRKNQNFVETNGWCFHYKKFQKFLKKALKTEVLFLEFGVGFKTPSIIRFPFEQLVSHSDKTHLIRFNKDYSFTTENIDDRTILFDEDILTVLEKIQDSSQNKNIAEEIQ